MQKEEKTGNILLFWMNLNKSASLEALGNVDMHLSILRQNYGIKMIEYKFILTIFLFFRNIIDAPGLRHFINHTIAGISQAEVAILIVSAKRGEFETSF